MQTNDNPINQYKLLDAQRKFLEIPHDYSLDVAVYQGGYGSGKTFAGSLLGIILSILYPKIRGLVGAQTFPLVRDTTLATYFEHLENMGFQDGKHYDYNKGDGILSFQNGSTILFRHLEEPSKLKSLNLGFVQIEEMSDVPESTFQMLLGRLRQKPWGCWSNFRYRIFGHTNPEQTKGWIYKTFVEDLKPNYRLIIAPTTQNKYLPEHFVEELKRAYDEEYFKINVLGEFGDYSSGLVVKGFSAENVATLMYCPELDLHLSCDFNVDPMCWVLAHKDDESVFFFDELVIENTTTDRACEEFLHRYPKHKGKIIVNGDASGDYRHSASEMTNYMVIKKKLSAYGYDVNFEIRPFNPPIKSRIVAFNSKVKNSRGNVNLYIDPKCKWLLYNINNLRYQTGTSLIDLPSHSQLKTDRAKKFLMHPFDAASYLVEYYWQIGR